MEGEREKGINAREEKRISLVKKSIEWEKRREGMQEERLELKENETKLAQWKKKASMETQLAMLIALERLAKKLG